MVAFAKPHLKPHTPDRSAKDSGRRFYSPEISRWLSRDPIEEWGGPNVYAFVLNSPVHVIDPRGREATTPSTSEGGFCIHWNMSLVSEAVGAHPLFGTSRIMPGGNVMAASTLRPIMDLRGKCPKCCIEEPGTPKRWRYESQFHFLRLDVSTTVYQNHIDGRGYSKEFIDKVMAFEGVWQAYFKKWYDITLPEAKAALTVPCHDAWKLSSPNAPKNCGAYQKCVRKVTKANLDELWQDMERLDDRYRTITAEFLDDDATWDERIQIEDPFEYMPNEFVPYPATEFDWDSLSYEECNTYK